jgi:protein transport protein SEC61 subunit gamma-like protein
LEYKRVITVTKKPTREEFITIVKVSGLGILVIGLLGFVIQMIEVLVFK